MQIEDVKKRIERIAAMKGVMGVIVAARDGMPIETTIDNTSTVLYIGGMIALEDLCTSLIRDVNPTNSLQFMRIRSGRFEIMLAKGDTYYTVVIQNPYKKKK